MSDTLTGLPLRRAACAEFGYELKRGNWSTFAQFHFYVHRHGKVVENTGYYCDDSSLVWTECLPAIESDPAVSEPMFLEWMTARKFTAVMTYGLFTGIQLYDEQGEECGTPQVGASPSEARAKTIVAAGGKA